jgi:chromosome segregation ATPase
VLSLKVWCTQRVYRQLANAHEKLERAQRHAEEKRQASQQTIDRLQREYERMDIERRDNDKQVEELREEADEIEAKVCFRVIITDDKRLIRLIDGRTPQEK